MTDFCPSDPLEGDPSRLFKDLVGCKESLMAKLKEYQDTIATSTKLGRDPLAGLELNFLFVGAPGTGKTTVARLVGRMFKSLGIISADTVIECSAKDFTTGFVGQSAGKTREMFEKALGQVLFIDEAYRYVRGIHVEFLLILRVGYRC